MSIRALLLSLVVAALSATLLVLYLRKLEVETSGGSPVRVLMVVKPLEAGTVLTEDAFVVRSVPQAYVESRAVRESDCARVLGLRVDAQVRPQQTLMWTDLAVTTDDRRWLSDLISPGMRAVMIGQPNDDQSFALIRPGDRVDVVGNLPHPKEENQRVAMLLAQNLLVLAVGTDMGAETNGPRPASDWRESVLTLSATIQQQQQLSLAAERGKLNVALKPRSSTETLEGVSDVPLASLYSLPERQRALLAAPPKPTGPANITGKSSEF